MKPKGTVTPLSSLFSVEDTQKAAKRVQDTIAGKDSELENLRGFVADNKNLINLVAKLPEQLHHDLMVPFGKAAFFPGRLVHTNEFMVLLGEGYYAERTSKQTVEILNRRGKVLESQVDSLLAMMQDLKAEASFFDATASEAAEGLVEIVEDYEEESSSDIERPLKQDSPNSFGPVTTSSSADKDEEFALMMARMDELEKEELEAECKSAKSIDDEQVESGLPQFSDLKSLHQNLKYSESLSMKPPEQTEDGIRSKEESLTDKHICSAPESISEDKVSNVNISASAVKSFEKGLVSPVVENVQTTPLPRSQVTDQIPKPKFDREKAFTGSIVEHANNLQTTPRERTTPASQSSASQSSKPVSRFKMQRK